ncbi:MAG: NEAT domain-containing protein [Clostridia bacterium]|nr:NEAT domain-containing protein [Clostridia bacterium]
MIERKTKLFVNIAFLAGIFISAIGLFIGIGKKTADAAPYLSDGTYTCSYAIGDTSSIGETMIGQNIDDKVKVEVKNGVYYLSVSYKTSAGMTDLALGFSGNVGKMQRTSGDKTTITYTLSKKRAEGKLPFSVYVSAMDRRTSFSITPDLSSAIKISDTIEDIGERPAEFVPVIATSAGAEYGAQSGSGHYFIIPPATATIGEEDCEVKISVTVNGEEASVSDGRFMIERAGKYILTYRAESDKYKTSEGNNTFSELAVTVNASAEASDLARFSYEDKVPEGLSLLVGLADENSLLFAKASEALKDISVKFSVFTVEIIDGGKAVDKLDEAVAIDLKADLSIDRTKAEAYRLTDDGKLEKLSVKGAGRYVRAEIDGSGTYIVLEPGVPFKMPRWAYAVIIEACVLIVGVACFFIFRARRKKGLTEKRGEEDPEIKEDKKETEK